MTHITTKVLRYEHHSEELEHIVETLKVLADVFTPEANRLKRSLVIRHDYLIMTQQPKLQDYQVYLRELQ